MIRGEPGVGKTALVAHVLRQVMAGGPDVTLLATTAVSTESSLSFGGLLGGAATGAGRSRRAPQPPGRGAPERVRSRPGDRSRPVRGGDSDAGSAGRRGATRSADRVRRRLALARSRLGPGPGLRGAVAWATTRWRSSRRFADGEAAAVPLDGLTRARPVRPGPRRRRRDGRRHRRQTSSLRVLAELVARTSGNPLALRESIAQLGPLVRRGLHPLPEHLPVSEGVAAALLQRVRALPESVSFALTVAAFESQGSRSVIDAAVGGDPSAAWRAGGGGRPDRGGPGVGPVLASTGARRARVVDDTRGSPPDPPVVGGRPRGGRAA